MGNDLTRQRREIISACKYEDIPPWYQRVSYLESSGTQFIVTDLVPTFEEGHSMNLSFTLLSTTPNTSIIFGCNGTALAYNVAVQLPYIAANGLRCDPTGIFSYFGKPVFGEEYFWTSSARSITTSLPNSGRFTADPAVEGNTAPLILFAQTDTGRTAAHCRISEVTYIRDYDVTASCLLPCIRDDGTAGMYDTITGKFFTNGGTGNFITGPAI